MLYSTKKKTLETAPDARPLRERPHVAMQNKTERELISSVPTDVTRQNIEYQMEHSEELYEMLSVTDLKQLFF